jgi:hypothetical protein
MLSLHKIGWLTGIKTWDPQIRLIERKTRTPSCWERQGPITILQEVKPRCDEMMVHEDQLVMQLVSCNKHQVKKWCRSLDYLGVFEH